MIRRAEFTPSSSMTRGYRSMVRAVYPDANPWWNCMEFSWVIWDRPVKESGRIVGEARFVDDAWMNAALRMGL